MLSKWLILVLTSTIVLSELSSTDEIRGNSPNYHRVARGSESIRNTRALVKPKGFFEKIFYVGGLIYQQYNETRSAIGRVRDIFYDSFSDTATTTKRPFGETTTLAPNASTTTEKYRISRAELGKILSRNFRGLQKLMRLEIADAKNQSRYTIADYKQQYYNQVKPPNKKIKVSVIERDTASNLV